MAAANNQPATPDLEISSRDILFECPACRKSLVIDEAAQGMIVDCPQCKTSVIVPPKTAAPAKTPTGAAPPPSKPAAPAPVAPEAKPAAEPPKPLLDASAGALLDRLVMLGNQLKELQTQRTEIATNVAARLNEINRQMVMLARQETAHHQVASEVQQLIQQLKGLPPKPGPAGTGKSQVNLRA
jgi:ribosomal protein S27E